MPKKKTTTDAIEILHDLFVRGRPKAEALLEQARERLRISMQLYDLREKAGLTQEDLAERAGTSRTVIARLEQPNYEKHTMSTLRKVAGAMGYTVKVEFVPVAKAAQPRKPAVVAARTASGRAARTARTKLCAKAAKKTVKTV